MKKHVRSLSVAWIVVSLVAGAAAQSPGFSAADSKELSSYRLTMDTARKAHAMMRSLIEEMNKDPKQQALMKTTAEIAALEKKEELTDAESNRLDKLREQKEQQEAALEAAAPQGLNMGNAATLTEMEASLKKSPPAMAALTKVGLAPREYSKFMLASLMAGMVAGFQKSGVLKEIPKELKEINPDNIKFMSDNQAELEKMQKDLERLSKGGN